MCSRCAHHVPEAAELTRRRRRSGVRVDSRRRGRRRRGAEREGDPGDAPQAPGERRRGSRREGEEAPGAERRHRPGKHSSGQHAHPVTHTKRVLIRQNCTIFHQVFLNESTRGVSLPVSLRSWS